MTPRERAVVDTVASFQGLWVTVNDIARTIDDNPHHAALFPAGTRRIGDAMRPILGRLMWQGPIQGETRWSPTAHRWCAHWRHPNWEAHNRWLEAIRSRHRAGETPEQLTHDYQLDPHEIHTITNGDTP